MNPSNSTAQIEVFLLYVPEIGTRKPIRSTLPCPERIWIAWHKQALGIWELLDEHGHSHGHAPQESLWQVREYQRAMHYPGAREAFYEEVTDAR